MPTQLLSFFSYEGQVRECILRSKFNSKEFMTLKNLCHYTFTKYSKQLNKLNDFTLVPIPLSKEKKIERGFNQAEVIAIILSKKINVPINRNLLVRALNTIPQYGNDRNTRFKNVQNAFKLYLPKINTDLPKKVLLVDDISTSGATFLEASRILLKAGVKEVRCLSISKKLFETVEIPFSASLKMPA
jgi:ComF family protein